MTATDQLAALDAKVTEAQTRYTAARDNSRRAGNDTAPEVLKPLFDYFADVDFSKRTADADEAQRITQEVCERIITDRLTLEVKNRGQVTGIFDPSFGEEIDAALKAQTAAINERNAYEVESRSERDAERRSREAEEIKEALDSGDADRIREALSGPPGTGPLASNELTSKVRVTRGV